MHLNQCLIFAALLSLPFLAVYIFRDTKRAIRLLRACLPTRALLISLFFGFIAMWVFCVMRGTQGAGGGLWNLQPGDEYGFILVLAFVLMFGFQGGTSQPTGRPAWLRGLAGWLESIRIGIGLGLLAGMVLHVNEKHADPYAIYPGDVVCVLICVVFMMLVAGPRRNDPDVTERVEHLRGTVLKDYDSLRDHDGKNPPEE